MENLRFRLILLTCIAMIAVGMALASSLAQLLYIDFRQSFYGDSDPMYAAFGACGTPCLIKYNGGGSVRSFEAAARVAKQKKIPSIVDGHCISACAIFADLARPFVCVTPLATLEFHKATDFRGEFVDPPQSQDVATWVANHGGYRPYELLVMHYLDSLQFWPSCRSPKSA